MKWNIYIRIKMEEIKKRAEGDKEIVFSKSVKAGKRIYYVDVKKNRKDELFIAVTESKKIVSGDAESPSVNFEKHKIFLYQEDFGHFMEGLTEAIDFIRNAQGTAAPRQTENDNKEKQEEQNFDFDIDLHVNDINLPQ